MQTLEDIITESLDGWREEQARICILVFPKRSGRTVRLVRMIREEYSRGSFASDHKLFSIPFIEDPEYDFDKAMDLHRMILGDSKIHGDFEIITCIADKQTSEPRSIHRLCTRVNGADLFDLVYEMSRDLTDPDLLSFTLEDKKFLKAYCRPMLEPARTLCNILHPYDDPPRFYKWKAVREKR